MPLPPREHVLVAFAFAWAACNLVDTPLSALKTRANDEPGLDAGSDGAVRDAGPDAPAPVDAALDAPGPEPEDAAVDSGLDSGLDSGPDSGPRPSCDDLYENASGYVFCDQTETECWFSADTPTNCEDVCEQWGGECLDTWDNPNDKGQECDHAEQPDPENCESEGRTTQLCVCTR